MQTHAACVGIFGHCRTFPAFVVPAPLQRPVCIAGSLLDDSLVANKRDFAFEEIIMLETIAVILLVLWLLGMISSYTIGGFIHLLLVVAIVMMLIRVISGRRPL